MSGTLDIYKELRKRYTSGWTPPRTEYPNESFTLPALAETWARFTVDIGDESQMDIGATSKTFRKHGALIVQLFAPQNKGSVDLLGKADVLSSVFRNWCGTIVSCQAASTRIVGVDQFGWYQINVIIPFKMDSLH
jgi:hypothetical protein